MKRTEFLHIRCTQREKNRMKGLARIYKYPSVSALIMDWVINGAARMNPKRKKK